MAVLVHFCKTDNTLRSRDSTAAEETNYTISWSDLTTAGFAAGDNAIFIVACKIWCNNAEWTNRFKVGFGTTYAGRTDDTTSQTYIESPSADVAGSQFFWVKQRALVNNENVYFTTQGQSTYLGRYQEFVCLVINYDDIAAGDKLYATATHSGNAPTTYTTGASAATGDAGDWLIFASSRWLVDGTAEDMYLAINDGTSDVAEVYTQSEDTYEERVFGTIAYRAGLGASVTVAARYKEVGATAPPDCVMTSIFGIRLDQFASHWGVHTTSTITHSVVDTYQEAATNNAYVLGETGPFVVLGWPIHATNEVTKQPYGRIQFDGSDWPAANANRIPVADEGAAARLTPFLFGYAASQAAATYDIDLDIAEDADITPNYNCVEQVCVAFTFSQTPPPETDTSAIPPDAIAASTNLAGAVTAIDEDPDSPDANWLTATSATAVTDVRVTFPTSPGDPYGAQNFRYQLRKTTGTPTPTITAELRQSNTLRKTLHAAGTQITSTSGQVLQGDWAASDLVTVTDGSDVELRIVSVPGYTPGAMPAYDGTGQAASVQTATITTAITPACPSTVAAGDLLILQVMARNDEGNGTVPATIANWTAFPGNPYGSAGIMARQGLYWKLAVGDEDSTTISVTCGGSTTADLAMARIYRFTAANGFAAAPIEGISTNEGASTSLSAPVTGATPGGTNRRAVCFGAIGSSDATIGNMTGETAGDWTEAATANTTTGGDGVLNVQTADASAGTAISGGAVTYTQTTGNEWTTVACYLVPANGAATNTVEIGAIEWNAQYLATGDVTLTADAGAIVLTGQVATLKRQRLAFTASSNTIVLTGQAATLKKQRLPLTAASNTAIVTGQVAQLKRQRNAFTASSNTIAVAGQVATLKRQRLPLTAASVSVIVTGQAATLRWQKLPLTASPGSVVVAGADAALKYQRLSFTASSGIVVLSGQSATLKYQKLPLVAVANTITVSGQDATLKRQRLPLTASSNSIAVNGQVASLKYQRLSITASPGSVVAIGQDVLLRYQRLPFTADSGIVIINGSDATLSYVSVGHYVVIAGSGTVSVAGQTASIRYQRNAFTAASGSIVLAGQSADLERQRLPLSATSNTISVNGQAANLRYQRLPLTASSNSIVINGQGASLEYQRNALNAQSNSIIINGETALLRYQRLPLTASSGTVAATGQDSLLKYQRLPLSASAGTVIVNGLDATLSYVMVGHYALTASSGVINVVGQAASVKYQRSALTAASGSIVLAGQSVNLKYQRLPFSVTSNTTTINGQAATLKYQKLPLTALSNSVTVSGQISNLVYQRLPFSALFGTILIDGADAGLFVRAAGRFINAEAGTVILVGQDVNFTAGVVLSDSVILIGTSEADAIAEATDEIITFLDSIAQNDIVANDYISSDVDLIADAAFIPPDVVGPASRGIAFAPRDINDLDIGAGTVNYPQKDKVLIIGKVG